MADGRWRPRRSTARAFSLFEVCSWILCYIYSLVKAILVHTCISESFTLTVSLHRLQSIKGCLPISQVHTFWAYGNTSKSSIQNGVMTIEGDPSCSSSTTSFHRHLYRSSCRADPTRHCHLTFNDVWKEMNFIFFSYSIQYTTNAMTGTVSLKSTMLRSYSQLHFRLHLSRSRYSFRFRTSVSPFPQVPPSIGRRNTRSRYEIERIKRYGVKALRREGQGSELRAQSSKLQASSIYLVRREARNVNKRRKRERTDTAQIRLDRLGGERRCGSGENV